MHPDIDPRPTSLARLLRALPGEATLPYGYHEFERRAHARARGARGLAGGRRLATAAVVSMALLAVLLRLGAPQPRPAPVRAAGGVRPLQAPGPDDEALPPRAGVAERLLASLPAEPAIVHFGTRAAVMGIEDRIAQVDDLLSAARAARAAPEQLAELQEERSRLLGTLVQVRYAETLARESP